ncbi:hypothetical protein HH_1545 [Helicobacter hepaticus ATCC 51449]|uniref:Uncharacterized protein n=1 Tax=Helicobacter hepaticus (strain ATCC 51449 / 3B1) TaxID=235279 RepID=Q7VFY0_HELHP|nr:hypothetical protein HH_1545 [Helicobacter hepaticus ATCC 51449]
MQGCSFCIVLELISIFSKVFCYTFSISFHTLITFIPACRTYFAVLFNKQHRIYHTNHFINITSKWKVINDCVANYFIFINKEATAKCNCTIKKHIIITRDLFCNIRYHRECYCANPSLIYRHISPRKMHFFRINRYSNHFYTACFKIFHAFVKSNNLTRTYKSKILRPKKYNCTILTDVFVEVKTILKSSICFNRLRCKIWCWFCN